jgi:hypothetical protein
MGSIKKVIGIRVQHAKDRQTVFLDQEEYTRDMLKLFGMENCNAVPTPANPDIKLTKAMCPQSDADLLATAEETIPYRSAVSALQYAVNTRPDIAHAVGQVARFVQAPGIMHYKALKRIFRYLQGTTNYGLIYARSKRGGLNYTLEAQGDSDWAGNLDDRRSTSGYIVTLNDNVISFKAKAQSCTALSTCEAETVAQTLTTQEVEWMRDVLDELGFPQIEPTKIRCDNEGAIAFSKDAGNHSTMKHINLREFYIKDSVAEGRVALSYIRSTDNTADILTKALGTVLFKKHRAAMNIVPRPAHL